jgi:hypothetical protein
LPCSKDSYGEAKKVTNLVCGPGRENSSADASVQHRSELTKKSFRLRRIPVRLTCKGKGRNEIAQAFAYIHALGGLTGFVMSFHIGTLISFLSLLCNFF